jgi:hypothetical protein
MKYTVATKVVHRHQELGTSCGAAAVAMLLGRPESEIRPLVHCTSHGTSNLDVLGFLSKHVAPCHYVNLHADYYDIIDKLIVLSLKFPLYCSATYLWKNPGRGRPVTRHHASIIVDGVVYDPAENREVDGASYETTFNKKLTYNHIIIVESERPNFLKNFKLHEVAA